MLKLLKLFSRLHIHRYQTTPIVNEYHWEVHRKECIKPDCDRVKMEHIMMIGG
jgi:hypothetical protein